MCATTRAHVRLDPKAGGRWVSTERWRHRLRGRREARVPESGSAGLGRASARLRRPRHSPPGRNTREGGRQTERGRPAEAKEAPPNAGQAAPRPRRGGGGGGVSNAAPGARAERSGETTGHGAPYLDLPTPLSPIMRIFSVVSTSSSIPSARPAPTDRRSPLGLRPHRLRLRAQPPLCAHPSQAAPRVRRSRASSGEEEENSPLPSVGACAERREPSRRSRRGWSEAEGGRVCAAGWGVRRSPVGVARAVLLVLDKSLGIESPERWSSVSAVGNRWKKKSDWDCRWEGESLICRVTASCLYPHC